MLDILKKKLLEAIIEKGFSSVSSGNNPQVIHFGCYVLVIGELIDPCNREAVLAQVDKFLNVVLELRKSFAPAKASDIYMMMTTPRGSDGNPEWATLAIEIERDDRLARKHVWLPNQDYSNFADFLDGTFFAMPWKTIEGSADALALLNGEIEMPMGWEAALLDPELDGVDLVKELIRIEQETVL